WLNPSWAGSARETRTTASRTSTGPKPEPEPEALPQAQRPPTIVNLAQRGEYGGTRIPHSFRCGPNGMTDLAYGTRDASDMCWSPRSNKVFFGGLGVIAR